jgi:hypothetical protein
MNILNYYFLNHLKFFIIIFYNYHINIKDFKDFINIFKFHFINLNFNY